MLTKLEQLEAIVAEIRVHLRKPSVETRPQGSPKLKFDASKIQWKQATGGRGPFEIAEKKMNEGNPDYIGLEKFLENAGGRVTSEGWFIWMFESQDAIGRKLKQKQS